MVTCNLKGGLGNQLFQIATTLAIAWDNQDIATFDFTRYSLLSQGYNPLKYKNNVYRNLNCFESLEPITVYNEPVFNYIKIPYLTNICLNGFFQSERYFSQYKERLIDIFKPTHVIESQLFNKYESYLSLPNCSIHVRRGDYLNFNNYNYPLDINYYLNAIKLFDYNTIFLVFSDDTDWCKANFCDRKFIIIENNSEILDFYLMSMCKNQIIANSSFSWWASWLNINSKKIVIAPCNWFSTKFNTKDLYASYMLQL